MIIIRAEWSVGRSKVWEFPCFGPSLVNTVKAWFTGRIRRKPETGRTHLLSEFPRHLSNLRNFRLDDITFLIEDLDRSDSIV